MDRDEIDRTYRRLMEEYGPRTIKEKARNAVTVRLLVWSGWIPATMR